jgi:ureidoacrylate peracid hydrolase
MSEDVIRSIEPALDRMLATLERKVEPSHAALIIVDIQNDFCADGGAFHKEGFDLSMIQATVPKVVDFVQEARKAGLTIIYIQSTYYAENNWYLSDVFLEHHKRAGKGKHIKYPLCEKGSWGADFYGGIKPLSGEIVVNKHRYSAFIETDLDLILRSRGIRTLIMSGVATDVCVEMTAKVGFLKDYYIVFLKDCTATTAEDMHNNTLRNIAMYYGEVVNSSEVVRCWEKK